MVKEVLETLRSYGGSLHMEKINDVLTFAEKKYSESGMKSCFPKYLLDVLLPFRPDEVTIIAGVLNELFTSELMSDNEVKNKFGNDVLELLGGVRRLRGILATLSYHETEKSFQLESLRKMFFSMAKDLRVVLLVLSCVLCRMKHLDELVEEEERVSFARKALLVCVPVAARLGIYGMKGDLEDLAFKYLEPDKYKETLIQLDSLRKSCDISISFINKKLEKFLRDRGIEASVSGRIKNIYSIYSKMRKKGYESISDLYDIFAIRIILPAKKDEYGNKILDHLYAVLGLIHSEWKPYSKRFKDYLAVPKSNGYRSLHTVVLGLAPKDHDQPVEIQIRDEEMHREAEFGIASHWLYKENFDNRPDDLKTRIDWIQSLEKIRDEADFDSDMMKEIEIDIFKDRIFVLTPRGEVKDLPIGSVPIDFAYSIHTDIGNKCVMAKVNGSISPLDYELQNSDVVEIITRKDATPKLQWLSIVKTNFARNKIKAWFSSLNKENNVRDGRILINNQLSRIGKPTLDNKFSALTNFMGKKLSLSQREKIVEQVGSGAKLASDIVRKIYPYEESVIDKVVVSKARKREPGVVEDLENKVLVGGESGLPIKLAACCKPKVNDSILGYVTRGNSITIHKSSCPLLVSLNNERFVFADWKGGADDIPRYFVGIKVLAMPRVGLMRDIASVISSFNVHIRDASIKKVNGGMTEESYLLELSDLDQFDAIVDKIENIKGVFKVSKDNSFVKNMGY